MKYNFILILIAPTIFLGCDSGPRKQEKIDIFITTNKNKVSRKLQDGEHVYSILDQQISDRMKKIISTFKVKRGRQEGVIDPRFDIDGSDEDFLLAINSIRIGLAMYDPDSIVKKNYVSKGVKKEQAMIIMILKGYSNYLKNKE